MPPRRSSRAASASLVTPLVETLPIKRKRGQTLEPHNVDLEEDDDVEANLKPKRGKRGSSVVKLSRSPRRSSRAANASLEKSDDEMDAMSLLSEVDEDEDVKPVRKGRKVPTARKAKVTTKKSIKTTVIEDSDDDSDIQAPPVAQPRSQQHNGASNAAQVVSNT
jgi:hypothetical protein